MGAVLVVAIDTISSVCDFLVPKIKTPAADLKTRVFSLQVSTKLQISPSIGMLTLLLFTARKERVHVPVASGRDLARSRTTLSSAPLHSVVSH